MTQDDAAHCYRVGENCATTSVRRKCFLLSSSPPFNIESWENDHLFGGWGEKEVVESEQHSVMLFASHFFLSKNRKKCLPP